MYKFFTAFAAWLFAFTAAAQQPILNDSALTIKSLEEVIFSANKFAEKKKYIVQKIEVISTSYIKKTNAQNTGDLLMSTGNVFVQKSQQGGSSPVIRGFEASRVLLIVDGIRMNNAVYRAGHLQNIITVDQNMLERVEVLYGPSSTLFGSDALGGAVHMFTKSPQLSSNGYGASGNAFARYSSANNEKTAHIDLNIGYKKIAFLSSLTYSDFEDMKMGDNYPDKYPDFGRRTYYVTQPNNSFVDLVVTNSDDRIQKFSAYKQWDFMHKILFKQNENITHLLNIQLSNSSNVPRYDRLQDIRTGTLRYAEWFYGPQKRDLFAYTFTATKLLGIADNVQVTASYQDIKESRQTRDFQRYDRFDSRREHVKVLGAVIDFKKVFRNNEITYGIDGQWNDVQSVADRTNLLTGVITKLDTRYSDGINKMTNAGLFIQHLFKFNNQKFVLNDGIRFQTVQLHSTITDNSFFNLPITDVTQNNFAVTGNIGVVYNASKSSIIRFGFATGFRAPNIDDLAKVFESSTALKQVVVPNSNLNPEYTYNFDLGLNQSFGKIFSMELNGFYTLFRNAIVNAPFQLNGKDSIVYNGTTCAIYASQNKNNAFLYGGTATIKAAISSHWNFISTVSYTYGRFKTDADTKSNIYQQQTDGSYKVVQANVTEKPLDHVPPVFGKTSIQYTHAIFNVAFFALYNGWKKIKDYNADGEDNPQYATADGIPSWCTVNFRAAVNVNKQIQLQASVENIFDRNYRYFASGFSAPGRNFLFSLRASF